VVVGSHHIVFLKSHHLTQEIMSLYIGRGGKIGQARWTGSLFLVGEPKFLALGLKLACFA
jgi:hypothetical protein